jgi:phosphoglycolate phosphatase
MHEISLIIFDLDGTLVDTLDDLTASVNYALVRLGKTPITRHLVRQYVGDGTRVLLTRALGSAEPADQALVFFQEHYRENFAVHSALYPGVRETLEHFKPIPQAVISNKTTEFIGPLLNALGIARYFKMAIGADHGIRLKPAPDSVLRIMDQVGVPGDRTVVVGDGTTDVLAGKAAGVITCAVTYGFRTERELHEAGPDYVAARITDLKEIFAPASQSKKNILPQKAQKTQRTEKS